MVEPNTKGYCPYCGNGGFRGDHPRIGNELDVTPEQWAERRNDPEHAKWCDFVVSTLKEWVNKCSNQECGGWVLWKKETGWSYPLVDPSDPDSDEDVSG